MRFSIMNETGVCQINEKLINLNKFTDYLKKDLNINSIGVNLIIQLLKKQNVNSDNYYNIVSGFLQ